MGNTLRRFRTWLHQNIWTNGTEPGLINQDAPSGDVSTQPPPYSQSSGLSALPEDNVLSNARTGTSISAALCVAAVEGGPAVAKAVAAAIAHVAASVAASMSVAAVPATEAQVTARVITTAVTNYAAMVAEEPGKSFANIYEQARESVQAASIPALSEGLPEALANIDHAISSANPWSRVHLASTIAHAVANVTKSVAVVSPEGGRFIADSYATCARDRAARFGNRVRVAADTGSGTRQLLDPASSERPSAGTNPESCEAELQMTQLQAALVALREHAAMVGRDVQAAVALAAVAAGARLGRPADEWPDATCTCSKKAGSCEAVLQAGRLRAVLHALWSYNAMVGNSEAVKALAAVATAAGFPPPREYSDTGQNPGSCNTGVLQAAQGQGIP
ncbi:hypothetical protein C8A01DRAFT_14033 [Parachaetomium inaequale]|uniref:Uncharacterized protein n=1 Tax=Parachaetomium inaequale TaxID=2588326 RepID=A0AAN6SUB4_9PEZI|nr:hypothetical protein C8A01DRAFT_14033 [Parachaetomium inaequale]